MAKIRMEIGELPEQGKFYIPKDQPLELYKNLDVLDPEDLDPDAKPPVCGVIPKGKMFMFAKVEHEERIPGKIKRVWFKVIYDEMIALAYNGQIPFHQFLLKVVEDP
jgi:hypothetical protein